MKTCHTALPAPDDPVSSETAGFPDAAELAALRAWYAGLAVRPAVEHIKCVNVTILNVSTGRQTAPQADEASSATIQRRSTIEIMRNPSSRERAQTEASNMAAIDGVIVASQGIAAAMRPQDFDQNVSAN
jgi:hypothetical protein